MKFFIHGPLSTSVSIPLTPPSLEGGSRNFSGARHLLREEGLHKLGHKRGPIRKDLRPLGHNLAKGQKLDRPL